MSRDGKRNFYKKLDLDKSFRKLIDFYNDWKKEAQKELNKRK